MFYDYVLLVKFGYVLLVKFGYVLLVKFGYVLIVKFGYVLIVKFGYVLIVPSLKAPKILPKNLDKISSGKFFKVTLEILYIQIY